MPTWLWIACTVVVLLLALGAIGASTASGEITLEVWTRSLRIHHPGGKICAHWQDVPMLLRLLDGVTDEAPAEICDAAGGSRLRLDKKTATRLRHEIARMYAARCAAGES